MTETVPPAVGHEAREGARRRLSSEDRRRAIIDAARAVFARKGFHGASTAEIAQAADCSEPTLFKYYPTKLDLFAAVLEDAHASLRERHARLLAAPDPVKALVEVPTRFAENCRFAEKTRLRTLALSLVHEPVVRRVLEETSRELRETAAAAVRTSQARGTVRADVDPESVAWIWAGLMIASGVRQALEGDEGLRTMTDPINQLYALLQPAQRGAAE